MSTNINTSYPTYGINTTGSYQINPQPNTYPNYQVNPGVTFPSIGSGLNQTITETPSTAIEGIDEIAELLGVEPDEGSGIMLTGEKGQYSLLAILKAHLDLMQHLHVLAVHTKRLQP